MESKLLGLEELIIVMYWSCQVATTTGCNSERQFQRRQLFLATWTDRPDERKPQQKSSISKNGNMAQKMRHCRKHTAGAAAASAMKCWN